MTEVTRPNAESIVNGQAPDPELVKILKTQLAGPNWEIFQKMTPEQQYKYVDVNKQTLLNMKEQIDRGETPAPPLYEVESFNRLSKSRLWSIMSNYFDRAGPESWSTYKVPYFVTSNSYIGRTYAQLLAAYVKDIDRDDSEPLYVMELGAGSGKFAFHFLQSLVRLMPDNPALSKVVYLMTDFTEKNVQFWQDTRCLKPFIDMGILDFAKFNNYTDESITLKLKSTKIQKGSLKNPLIVIANYVLDSMAVDLFRFQNGKVYEGQMSLRSKQNETDINDPEIFNRMLNVYQYNEIPVDFYLNLQDKSYEFVHNAVVYDDILRYYRDYYAKKCPKLPATVLFPVTMLNCLDRIAQWSNYKMLLLSADKGTSDPNAFINIGDPFIAVHGSVSLMANYHATGLWFTQHGGVFYHNAQHDGGIRVSCFIANRDNDASSEFVLDDKLTNTNRERAAEFPHFSTTYQKAVVEFGPSDFYTIHRAVTNTAQITIPLEAVVTILKDAYAGNPFEVTSKKLIDSAKQIDMETIIGLIKLSNYDTDTFFNFKDIVAEKVALMNPLLKQDLFNILLKLWDNHYPLHKDRDIAFEFGRIFYKTKDYQRAIDCYNMSAKTNPALDVINYNIAVCYKDLGDKKNALLYVNKSLEANPEYERTKILLHVLQAESEVDTIVDKLKIE
jgi:hypothetical protein